MRLVDGSVKRPVAVFMIVLAVLAMGFVSFQNLAVDLMPEIELPIVVVATSYSGAGPQEVEQLITRPLEASLSSLQGLDTMQSSSRSGSSLVMMLFATGTDLNTALADIRDKVDQVRPILPDDASDPSVLRFDPNQIPVMFLGLTGQSPEKLQDLATNEIEPQLTRTNGVASITTEGGKTREILVELDRSALARYGLSTGQILQTLNSENQSASAGVISRGDQDLQIRVDGEFSSLEQIERTLLPLPQGGTAQLSDVAEVKDTFKDVSVLSYVNGEPALVLSVLKQSDANTVSVANAMYRAIDRVNESLPDGVQLSIVMDTSLFIKQSIDSVTSNMIVGGLVAMLILIVFLRSFRATLVIGVSIPIAVVAAFSLMYFSGQTVNILSMGGLALGIGMMVDSSIVILENIFSYRQKGYSVIEAAKKGGSELASAVIASTTTTVVVFLPIVYVEGMASDLFTPLALTVTFSLVASLVAALTIVPMLSSKLLTSEKFTKVKTSRFDGFFRNLLNKYGGVLGWAIKHRKTTIFVTILAIIASLVLIPFVGAEFIPAADQGQLQITVKTPSGSELQETEAAAWKVMDAMQPYRDIIDTSYLTVGSADFSGLGGSSNQAVFTVQLIPSSEREMTTQQFVKNLNEEIEPVPGTEIEIMEMSSAMSLGDPILIQISGQDREVLEELADQVVYTISNIPGIYNAKSSAEEGNPELQVEINRQLAMQYGLTYQQVLSEINLAFQGQLATRYREGGSEYDVRLILPEEQRDSIEDIETLLIPTNQGNWIPLKSVATLKQVQGPAEIQRENQQRQINVTSGIMDRNLAMVTADVQAAIAAMNMPDGYTISMGGQSEEMAESFGQLTVALLFSIFLVYVVMAVQFESMLYPFIIMFSMPTTIVGVILGLFITGTPLSIPGFIGLIMLAGVVVNNGIILVDYINILRRRGTERNEAIVEAGKSRVRPIFMTTLTTVIAMVPLMLGIGEGAEMQQPLAVVMIFGLSVSSLFTLIFVPVMYSLLDDMSKWPRKVWNKLFKRKSKPQEDKGLQV